MVSNERGFTLVEALVSLMILGVVSLVSLNFVVNLQDYIRLNQTLAIFQADLHHARDFNMMQLNYEERMVIRIYHDENRYVILVGDELWYKREMPANITIPHQNQVSNISFTNRGNLGAGRTIHFASRYHERRVVFSVGVGGFDVR